MFEHVLPFCPRCAKRNEDELKICKECGKSLERNKRGHSRPQRTVMQRVFFKGRR